MGVKRWGEGREEGEVRVVEEGGARVVEEAPLGQVCLCLIHKRVVGQAAKFFIANDRNYPMMTGPRNQLPVSSFIII